MFDPQTAAGSQDRPPTAATAQTPALVLLSGGLDSLTALAQVRAAGYAIPHTVTYAYGQRHVREIAAAAAIAAHYGLPHQVIALAPIPGSPLTDRDAPPQDRERTHLPAAVAPTYVPNRNMILLAYAAAQALLSPTAVLVGGWNATDAAGYPDCGDAFLEAMETSLRYATRRPFRIVRPLIGDDKAAVVRRAVALQAPIHLTWTCYQGGTQACGRCDACQLRLAAFRRNSLIDPIPYAIGLNWAGCRPYEEARP